MKRHLTIYLIATICLSIIGCRKAPSGNPPQQAAHDQLQVDRRVRDHFGQQTWDVITQAQRVEVYRLNGGARPGDGGVAEAARFAHWPITAGPTEPSPTWTDRLRAILADEDTYDWRAAKGCEPMPGVGVRFVRGDQRVDVWLCYSCEMLGMERYEGHAAEPVHSASEDFDFAAAALIQLAKEAFPDDPAIQALPDWEGPI